MASTSPGKGEYSYLPIERVHFGPGSIEKLAVELTRLGSKKPFLITGQTIASQTDLVACVEEAANVRLAGTFSGIKQHAPRSGITEAARQARLLKADSLISLGGGSPIDSVKIVAKELSADFSEAILPHVAIPTTLSAAEFSYLAGMTDEASKRKVGFKDPRMVPRIVFLDPELTVPTPPWLWACTGIRSLDHAVESVYSPMHQPYVDALALEAIHLIFRDLKSSTQNPRDLGKRLSCQMAAWMSFAGVISVGTGLSHAIGRVIGATWNIPHGITSCITLPDVMRMESEHFPDRLALIARAEDRDVKGLSLPQAARQAWEGVKTLVEELGLTKRLRDYGIKRDDLKGIADAVTGTKEYQDTMKILERIY